MSRSGFENERALQEALHHQRYEKLNDNLKQMLHVSFRSTRGLIRCEREGGEHKSDLRIHIGSESHSYSVKKGRGNSVHQEPVEAFIIAMKRELGMSDEVADALRAFIWGDGTLDGTGEVSKRMASRSFKKQHPERIKRIQRFLDTHREALIRRFVIEGVSGEASAEFVYYGNVTRGFCVSSDRLLEWLVTRTSRGVLSVGRLTLQAWNRNLKGKPSQEKKRGMMQLKWGQMKKDMRLLSQSTGYRAGKTSEEQFVERLNRKAERSYWDVLGLPAEGHYAIRVKYQQYGKLSGRKVWAKADAFIASGSVDPSYLEQRAYRLDEDDGRRCGLRAIEGTGISIKRPNSQAYQIIKMRPETFAKLFGSTLLAAGASLYCKKLSKLHHNEAILRGWGVTVEAFLAYYSNALEMPIGSVSSAKCQRCLRAIKRYAKATITEQIKNDPTLAAFLFLGVGNFDEPYTAHWLYEEGILRPNRRLPFRITTGSGRSRGRYTLVVKPK
ncbi:MAG TPA: hypothetical protein ENK86_03895 [Campylobacterales bacterium]|nr:hypothetical protein [Campylobacterales bacterium]